MRYVKIMLMIILLYILQSSLFAAWKIGGVVPNTVAVCLVCFSLHEDDWFVAAVLGVISGFLLDTTGGAIMGMNALLCMYLSIVCSVLSKRFFRGKFMVSVIFVFLMSIIYEALLYIFGFELWRDAGVWFSLVYVILPVSIYNTVIAMILYYPVRSISEALE